MNFIIYLSVFGAVCLLAYFFIETTIPLVIGYYNKIQAKRAAKFSKRLEDSFIFLEKRRLLLISLFPFIFAGIGFILFKNILAVILSFLLGFGFPNLLVNMAKQQRLKKFRSQMVDSLMIISSSLKAGLSFIQAIEILSQEMPIPIAQEFNLVLSENKLGMSLEESLRKLRERVPLEEVNLLISSILIARESGGELTKVLSRLTETIRNNVRLKEKITTLTLQGRLQGIIMMFLPIGFTYFVFRQNPNHFDVMLQSNTGRMLVLVAIFAQFLGMYLIKRISTIKI